MVKTIEDKKEIVRSLISLIWEATDGKIKKIVFNNQSRSAAIFLSDDTEDTENLNVFGVVLIAEETYQKIINDLADMKGKDSIATKDVFNIKILMRHDVQTYYLENYQKNIKLVEDIEHLKNEIKNYEIVSIAINDGSEIQKNIFSKQSNYNFQCGNVFNNAERLNRNLCLKHKRLINKLKEPQKNNAVFGV
ncbi:4571_t:CDS:2, partial [Racocetra persica]